MINDKTLLIIGAGGHARSVADVALQIGYKDLVFWDKNAKENEKIFNFPVVKDIDILNNSKRIIVAIGDNEERERFFSSLNKNYIVNIISSLSYLGRELSMENGNFISHGSYIGPLVKIGINNIINTHCVIEHECEIGNNNHISINSTIAGRCKIRNNVFVGAGSIIKDRISICSNVIVGAGSVVVKDIIESGTYIGIPAKKIK